MGLLLALLLAAGPAAAPRKIAVLDVRTGPKVDAALGPYLTQVLAGEVGQRTGSAPLVSADLKALLGFEKTRRSFGCDDEDSSACIVELAGALGADEVINTQLLTSDGPDGKPARYLLTASRLDAHKGTPLARDAQSLPFGDGAALEAAVRRAAGRLFGGSSALPAAPSESVSTTAPPAHRTVTWVAAAGSAALATAAAVTGTAALSAANAGNSSARTTAHAADALWVGAALCAGLAVWLWSGDGATAPAGQPAF